MAGNDDHHFRDYPIERLVENSTAIRWELADLLIMYRHMARYRTTASTFGNGINELARDLGIQDRSIYSIDTVLNRAKRSMLYHVKGKFRKPRYQVLVQTDQRYRGAPVQMWPQYFRQWLKPDWSGDPYEVPDGEDPTSVRTDPPGLWAITPEPKEMKQRQQPRRTGVPMSGVLPNCSTTGSAQRHWTSSLNPPYGTAPLKWSQASSDSCAFASTPPSTVSDTTYVHSTAKKSTRRAKHSIPRPSRGPSYMGPSIIEEDDEDDDHEEAHFSDSSDRTVKLSRTRYKEPEYLSIPLDSSESSGSSLAGAGLDSRLSKTKMRTKYLLNIIKLMVPWKRDIDEWRTQEEMAKMDKISSPPTEDPSPDGGSEAIFPEPPSYNIPSTQAMHYFPNLPAHIANFDHSAGRLLRGSAVAQPVQGSTGREADGLAAARRAGHDVCDGAGAASAASQHRRHHGPCERAAQTQMQRARGRGQETGGCPAGD
ncbi:hypothetical protein FMUND_7596 [Fusarium mundagurra]|uniref:Uncharacterized protein n=1 Tax=Fusarium mundagurra TaxID=1567541 RepID=A0A8H5YL41_9HYPO|nr:hypothetical protein FMUND_7596 [Fusarium mundagurra]